MENYRRWYGNESTRCSEMPSDVPDIKKFIFDQRYVEGEEEGKIAGDPKHTTQEDPYLAASLKEPIEYKLEVTFPEDVSGINRVDITDVYPEGYLLTSLDDLKYRVIGEPAIVVDQTKVIFDRPTETLYTTNKAFIEEMAGRTWSLNLK